MNNYRLYAKLFHKPDSSNLKAEPCEVEKYALTELMVCNECGSAYRRVTWIVGGQKRFMWRCISRLDHGSRYCKKSPSLREDKVQQAILNAINDTFGCEDNIRSILKSNVDNVISGLELNKIKTAEARLHEIDKMRNDLVTLIASGAMDEDSLDKQFQELYEEEQEITEEIEMIKREKQSADNRTRADSLINRIENGPQAVKKDEYSDYEIFIVCSEKYHSGNSEAKKYEHFLSYEECLEYFEAHSDTLNSVRAAWCRAAIIRSKKPYESNINEAAYDYFNHYREYMQKNYPHLDIRTKKSANGWWVQYGTTLGQAFIYHKTQEGYVDLTFPNAAEYMDTMQRIASWLRDNGNDQIIAVRTAKSAALRIECPKLKVKEDYSKTSEGDLRVCFDAISKLTEIASIFSAASKMSELEKKG